MIDTNKIADALISKAVEEESAKLRTASGAYKNLLRVNGCIPIVVIRMDDKTININIEEIFAQINKQIIERKKDSIASNAIGGFLQKFNQFGEAVEYLQNYEG